jgi:hypothetical protein
MSGLTEEEIQAIAEHEHVPEVVAAELGSCLLESSEGICLIRRYMVEDIENAQLHGKPAKAMQLNHVLNHFNATHPA